MAAEIPENEVTPTDLVEWYKLQEELRKVKAAEMLLRTKIFKHYFPVPKEGTNTSDPIDETGAVVKGGYELNRSVDVGTLDAVKARQTERLKLREQGLQDESNEPILPLDKLVKWKPELVKSEYNKLTEEEKQFFDQCLIIKPGSPSLEIVIPKRPAK